MGSPPRRTTLLALALLGVTALGAYFRFRHLGVPALRADTITFWKICQQDISWLQICQQWTEMGHTGHFPFANAFIKWFLDTFNLACTHTTIRIPSAMWGTLTVPAAFGLGRVVRGRAFGFFLAAFVALNPYHIQFSQEAYFYPPMILGAFLVTWSALWAFRSLRGEQPLSAGFAWLTGAGVFLLTYSLPGGWLLFIVCLPIWITVLVLHRRREGAFNRHMARALIAVGVLMIPFFVSPWGFSQFGGHVGGGAVKEAGLKALAADSSTVWTMLYTMATAYGWGSTPLRLVLMVVVLAAALWATVRHGVRDRTLLLLPAIFVVSVLLFMVARRSGGMLYQARYIMPAMPVFFAFLGLGVFGLFEALRTGKLKQAAAVAVLAVVLAPQVYPAFLATNLTGRPTPYKEIIKTVDSRLPKDTVVLVDRWLEPWNELAVYPSTNVHFTFTIPNEPLETFLDTNWRRTAVDFFEANPGAAYLEIAKTYWDIPEVGPWPWSRDYFEERVEIRNEAGVKLRQLGLAARGDFYAANTNRTITELFFSSRAGARERARSRGQELMRIFGKGWGYTKTRDWRGWRILKDRAFLELYNLTGTNIDAQLVIEGLTIQGTKQVTMGKAEPLAFRPQQPSVYRTGPFTLTPGRRTMVFQDPNWNQVQVPLLVSRIELQPAEPSP